MPNVIATKDYSRRQFATAIAEFTSGMVSALPEQDDFDRADKIMKTLEEELTD